jgi:hypothetical protein
MKPLGLALFSIVLLTGCLGVPAGAPSSQVLDCVLNDGVTAPVGVQWLDVAYAAIEGWPKPTATGPWEFTALGPPTARQVRTVVVPADAPHAAQFPRTAYVVRTEVEGVATAVLYRFYEERDDGLYWLGDSDQSMAVLVSPPPRFLPRGLRLGQRWEERYRDSRFDLEVTAEHEVVGCGEARVPAGRFANTLLVRSSYRYAESPGASIVYSWHAPGTGLIAATTASSVSESTVAVTALLEHWSAGGRLAP